MLLMWTVLGNIACVSKHAKLNFTVNYVETGASEMFEIIPIYGFTKQVRDINNFENFQTSTLNVCN